MPRDVPTSSSADVSETGDGPWRDGIGTALIAWPSMPSSAAIQRNSTDLESRHHGGHAMVARFDTLVILQSETMN